MKIQHVMAAMAFFTALSGLVPAVQAKDPAARPDRSWISISGVVANARDSSFVLDYGEGLITVEMDDWDWYKEGKALISGDNVVVYGRVDNDLYQTATIEASSVYVKGLNTYFYANDADEEDWNLRVTLPASTAVWLDLTGAVTSVDGREFTLDTGTRKVTVDTISMPYNPMDKIGFQRIKKGDLVRVYGNMDYDLFEKKELMAEMVITLLKDKTKTSK